MLLPNNLHEQLMQKNGKRSAQVLEQHQSETNSGSRMRTPSPPCAIEEIQPPVIRFAPPYFGIVGAGIERRRRRPKAQGYSAWEFCESDSSSISSCQDWESCSQASEWDVASRSSHRGRRSGTSFVATNLSYLESKDSACVIAVKKITKLGFDAAKSLRAHFEQWGPVEEVLLSNVPVSGEPLTHASGMRRRPPGMGWVVMKNANDAQRALSHGESQTVQAAQIKAAPFIKKLQCVDEQEMIAEDSAEDRQEDRISFETPYRGLWSDA